MQVTVVEVGLITPPIGMNVFLIAGMSRTVSIRAVFMGTSPFLLAMAVLLALLMLFPDLALFTRGR